mmetsp:Transcript_163094/g.522985  ORF Transcript_163094/g.522985 Transcript_163094/m.522985 type:complete len:462 (-) Transcript_163094:111-1496(-)
MPPNPQLSQRLSACLRKLGLVRRIDVAGRRPAMLLVFLLAMSAVTALARRSRRRLPSPVLPVALSAVLKLLRERSVQELVYREGGGVTVRVKGGARFSTWLVPGSESTVFKLADEVAVPSLRYAPVTRDFSQVLSYVMLFLMLFAWYKAAKSLVSRDEKFVPRKGERKTATETTSFADVVCKSKIELTEIVDFLNHPAKFLRAGAKLPRGTLLVGPSGTGKTLLARAVAGEARCAFLSASASEFVEVYVGRGAARVRDLFRQAREMAPVVVFIDELDALGNRRGNAEGRSANEEYVQTLNQLLTELDGFHGQSDGVVVLAATNRREAVDSALLRPGRFDRHVLVELPDEEERLQILQLHAGHAAMAEALLEASNRSVLERIAEASEGLSGAELANIINEAVFLAMRRRRSQITSEDLQESLARARTAKQGASAPVGANSAAGFSQAFLRAWPTGPMMAAVR